VISKKTKYGIKALSHLAQKEWGKPTQIAEISKDEHIPRKFLEAILLVLVQSLLFLLCHWPFLQPLGHTIR